ncbi:hypothetical protein ISN75_12015 [Dyella marensis]|uniref:hypothetical protein n=1 Tax=Dyella marensis TaxID=500610 RepID=UPI0031DD2DE8
MRSSIISLPFRFAAIALAIGLAGAADAAAASNPPTPAAAAQDGQRTAPDGTASGVDRNVDYPSQLGPEGPRSGGTASLAAAHRTPDGAALAQQPAAR